MSAIKTLFVECGGGGAEQFPVRRQCVKRRWVWNMQNILRSRRRQLLARS
jgi:hypothetical protein